MGNQLELLLGGGGTGDPPALDVLGEPPGTPGAVRDWLARAGWRLDDPAHLRLLQHDLMDWLAARGWQPAEDPSFYHDPTDPDFPGWAAAWDGEWIEGDGPADLIALVAALGLRREPDAERALLTVADGLEHAPDAPRPLAVAPMTLTRARRWVDAHHSHLPPPPGGLCAVGVRDGAGALRCVAILGRPVARQLDDGATAEITRVASDGTRHAASKAIAALTRAAVALGYRRIVSYTIVGEAGTCYRAAGWRVTGLSAGGEWGRRRRRRRAVAQPGRKARWETGPDAAPLDPDADKLVRDATGKVAIPRRKEGRHDDDSIAAALPHQGR